VRAAVAAMTTCLASVVGCQRAAPESRGPVVANAISPTRAAIVKAAVEHLVARGDRHLDRKSGRIIRQTPAFCDVLFMNPDAVASGEKPDGEVLKVDRTTLAGSSYGAD